VIQTDAIILAKGAPNRCRDGRTVMCGIALSKTLGLFRIYPLTIARHSDVSVWSIVKLDLAISETDNRTESYKIIGYEVVGDLTGRNEKRDVLESCILKSGETDPIDYQNQRRKSIAIVRCSGKLGASLVARESESDIVAGSDEDGFALTQSEFPFKPYLEWTSDQGGTHRTHMVGQEVYMGMMNNQSTPFRIFENLHIGDRDYEHWLILGNMKDRRNVWVAAHVHRQKKIAQPNMFTSCGTEDGYPEGWPYETQEATDVRFAEKCPLFNSIT